MKRLSSTQKGNLTRLEDGLGEKIAGKLTASDVIEHVRRRRQGEQPIEEWAEDLRVRAGDTPFKKGDDRIFPYNSKSVGTAFTRACKALAIDDLSRATRSSRLPP